MRQDGFIKYECDRCGLQAFIQQGTLSTEKWYEIHRIHGNNVSENYMLCEQCYQAYTKKLEDEDTAFFAFMKEGKTE